MTIKRPLNYDDKRTYKNQVFSRSDGRWSPPPSQTIFWGPNQKKFLVFFSLLFLIKALNFSPPGIKNKEECGQWSTIKIEKKAMKWNAKNAGGGVVARTGAHFPRFKGCKKRTPPSMMMIAAHKFFSKQNIKMKNIRRWDRKTREIRKKKKCYTFVLEVRESGNTVTWERSCFQNEKRSG